MGKRAAHRYIKNARVFNVYTGEVLPDQGVALWGERIAYVGESAKMVGPETEIIDGEGMYLLPGFIDPHGHTDFYCNPIALAERALATGTTAIMTDTHDIVSSLGSKGLDIFIDATERLPLKFFFCLPAGIPQFPEWEGNDRFPLEDFEAYLGRERVLGLGEVIAWTRMLSLHEDILSKIISVRNSGKRVEGHTAGCSPDRLNALVVAGITSCHEPITAEEVRQRLRLGLYVMLRHGSIRADMDVLAALWREEPDLDASRVMLTPDSMFPSDLLKHGYMDYVVRAAIQNGIPPIKAIQMATINPATYMGLDFDLGGIAPGRWADLLLVEDPGKPRPVMVMCNGRVVARQGQLIAPLRRFPPSALAIPWHEQRRPRSAVQAQDFLVPGPGHTGPTVTVPCIHMVDKVITARRDVTLPVKDGYVVPVGDVLKASILGKDCRRWVTGFVSGLGVKVGGLATTFAHDTHKPMVLGCRDEDMVLAMEWAIKEGGMVVVERGKVVKEFHTPLGGTLPGGSLEQAAEEMEGINSYLRERGCPLENPVFTISFLTFTLPALRLTPSGVLDVRAGKIIFPLDTPSTHPYNG